MRIVPVIDLKDGRAVHARGGDRRLYRPLKSLLAGGSADRLDEPARLAAACERLLRPTRIYVADLDRIAGTGRNDAALAAIRGAAPRASLLWDGGFTGGAAAARLAARATPIVASETIGGPEDLPAPPAWVGIDLVEGGLHAVSPAVRALGEIEFLRRAVAAGAAGAVVVLVDRVGSGSGLPIGRLERLRRAAPGIPMLAGGGIATIEDLAALRDAGCDGALVATAVHDGRLPIEALAAGRFIEG